MRVPVLIPISGKKIRVTYVDYLEGNLFAEITADRLKISVSKTRNESPTDVWRSLFHELAHAALDFSGHCKWLSEKKEEAIVHAFENALSPLLLMADIKGMRWRDVTFPWEE